MTEKPRRQAHWPSLGLVLLAYVVYGVSLLVPAVGDSSGSEWFRGPYAGWVCAIYYPPAYPLNAALILLGLAYWRTRRQRHTVWRTGGLWIAVAAFAIQILLGAMLVKDENASILLPGYYLWLGTSVLYATAFWIVPRPPPEDDEEPLLAAR